MSALFTLLLLPISLASFESTRDSVSVIMPTALAKRVGDNGRIPAKPALFGKFYYGRILDAPFRLLNQNATDQDYFACDSFNVNIENLERPFIALVRRGGGCTFVEKARNVQDAGAAAMVVVNHDNSEPEYMGIKATEYALGNSVDIPVMMIRHIPGEDIIKESESGKVRCQLQVLKPSPAMKQVDALHVDLYLRLDETPADFLPTFSAALASLGDTVKPTIHFAIGSSCDILLSIACTHDILPEQWQIGQNAESCTNNKRYCSQSWDVVAETLRQLCIFKAGGWKTWASYYHVWMSQCGSKKDFSDSCFRRLYKEADNVDRCIAESGGLEVDAVNTLLESELRDRRQIRYSPILIINDNIFESQLSCKSVHDCAPLSFLCMMFADSDQPSTCFTSSACNEFGEVPDVCGTCRRFGDDSAISDPALCPLSAPSQYQRHVPFATIFVIFVMISLFMFVVVVSINHHLRRMMRQEVDTIMSEYTPLHDTEPEPSFSSFKESYRIPAA